MKYSNDLVFDFYFDLPTICWSPLRFKRHQDHVYTRARQHAENTARGIPHAHRDSKQQYSSHGNSGILRVPSLS
jgi:hypothetical protein